MQIRADRVRFPRSRGRFGQGTLLRAGLRELDRRHKPLLKLLVDRALDDVPNPRRSNLKEKVLRYRFRITHVPGMRNKAAYVMSRRPVGSALRPHMNLPDDNAAIVNHIPSSVYTDVLSLLRRIEPADGDYVEEANLTWCAAGLESLRSVTWDRVREDTSSDVDMHTATH